jgi:hypothetical protein
MINTTNMSNDPYESDDIESSYEQKEKEKTIFLAKLLKGLKISSMKAIAGSLVTGCFLLSCRQYLFPSILCKY